MKSVKTKVRDSVANVGNLKDQLNCVLKEIHLFSTKIEDMKAHSKEEDLGYKRFADLDARLAILNSKFKQGKEASRATMFLIKTIIESLTEGPLSEKDLKSIVLDKCKELGIKSTNRGTIAGLNMDVGVACNILSHLGVIEPHTVGTSTPAEQREAGKHIQIVLDQRWEAHLTKYFADCKKEASNAATAAAAAALVTDGTVGDVANGSSTATSSGAVMTPSATIGTESNGVSSLERRLLSPLLPSPDQFPLNASSDDLLLLAAPSQDLADYSFGMESPVATSGNNNNNNNSKNSNSKSHPSAPNSLAGSNASVHMSSSERISQCFDHSGFDDPSSSHMDTLINLDQSALNDSELMDSLMVMSASPIPQEEYDDMSPEDFGGLDVQVDDTASVAQSTKSNGQNHSSGQSQVGGAAGGTVKTKGVGSGRRSTASQKLWRIKTPITNGLEGLLRPEETLKQLSNVAFKESLSLEIEEHLLRRIAGQCDLHVKVPPFRSGTRYLDPNNVSFEDTADGMANRSASPTGTGMSGGDGRIGLLSHSSSVSLNSSQAAGVGNGTTSSVPALYDDHLSITGHYLLDKVKRSKRQRGVCLYGSSSSVPQFNINYIHSLSNICASTTSHYWNNTLLKHAQAAAASSSSSSAYNALSSSASSASLSSFVTGGSNKKVSSVSAGKASMFPEGTPHALYPKHYSQPTSISNESMPMPIDRRPSAAALAASTVPTLKTPLHTTAMYMPDLSVYTTEEPWSTVSKEFVVLCGEDAGAVFFDASNNHHGNSSKNNSNHSTLHSGGVSDGTASATSSNKKQKLSKPDSNSNLTKSSTISSSNNIVGKKALLPIYDVSAPQFREVVPPPHRFTHGVRHTTSGSSLSSGIGGGVFYPSPNKVEPVLKLSPAMTNGNGVSITAVPSDDGEDEEDLSDEAVLAKHDAVLRNMREKWAQLQQLKMETRRGAGGDFTSYKKQAGVGGTHFLQAVGVTMDGSVSDPSNSAAILSGGAAGGGPPYPGSGTHMKYRKYQNGEGGTQGGIASGGTKKKGGYVSVANGLNGSNAMKRRGRPPKFVKSAHGTSQRGNNQYTAIRAAAAAAAALSLQLQQQQQDAAEHQVEGSVNGSDGFDGDGDNVGVDDSGMEVDDMTD